MKRWIVLCGLLLAAFLSIFPTSLFLAVAQGGTSAPFTTATIRAAIPTNLDPVSLAKGDMAGRDLAENLFLGLVRYNPPAARFEPALAKSWTVSADGLTWVFQLRTDVFWVRRNTTTGAFEKGRPVAPSDFVYGIRRACDQTLPNPATPSIFIIAGCVTINNANPVQVTDIFIARNLKVIATGADKLEITFAFPASYTPALLALPEFRPVAREAVTPNPTGWATSAATLVTNGPYLLESWNTAQAKLIRNPFWPDPFKGNVGDVIYQDLPTFDASRLDANPSPSADSDAVLLLGFSVERPGVSVEGFRRALALSVDRAAILQPLNDPRWMPAHTIVKITNDPAVPGALDAARAALDSTPYAKCNRLPEKFDIGVLDAFTQRAATILISGWNKALGCNPASFNIRMYDPQKLLNIARGAANVDENQQGAPRPHLWIVSWSADYMDEHAWLGDLLHCRYGYMRSNIACGQADDLVDQAGRETDSVRRRDLYSQAQVLWFGVAGTFPVAPLVRYPELLFIQDWVTNALDARTAGGIGGGFDAPFRFDQWQIDTAKQPQ